MVRVVSPLSGQREIEPEEEKSAKVLVISGKFADGP